VGKFDTTGAFSAEETGQKVEPSAPPKGFSSLFGSTTKNTGENI